MNYKLEKFWNGFAWIYPFSNFEWTINLKSFEIDGTLFSKSVIYIMNYKLEKFWNSLGTCFSNSVAKWTINLKSFEITVLFIMYSPQWKWTINLKSFEIS